MISQHTRNTLLLLLAATCSIQSANARVPLIPVRPAELPPANLPARPAERPGDRNDLRGPAISGAAEGLLSAFGNQIAGTESTATYNYPYPTTTSYPTTTGFFPYSSNFDNAFDIDLDEPAKS